MSLEAETRAWVRGVITEAAPLLGGFLGYGVAIFVLPARAEPLLFETAAQVIPVLLLALAIEARLLGWRVSPPSPVRRALPSRPWIAVADLWVRLAGPITASLLAALLVASELYSFAVLNGLTPTVDGARVVYGAVAAGMVTIVVFAVAPRRGGV